MQGRRYRAEFHRRSPRCSRRSVRVERAPRRRRPRAAVPRVAWQDCRRSTAPNSRPNPSAPAATGGRARIGVGPAPTSWSPGAAGFDGRLKHGTIAGQIDRHGAHGDRAANRSHAVKAAEPSHVPGLTSDAVVSGTGCQFVEPSVCTSTLHEWAPRLASVTRQRASKVPSLRSWPDRLSIRGITVSTITRSSGCIEPLSPARGRRDELPRASVVRIANQYSPSASAR